ncbi:MAG: carboxypeptidase-like regulatory domain-containing protein [Kofleriaceae bacterium]
MRAALASAIVVVVLASTAAADDQEVTGFITTGTGQLSGRVTDLDGKPLRGLTVHLVPKTGSERTVTTDADGKYRAQLSGGEFTYVYVEGKVKIGGQAAVAVKEGDLEAIEIRETLPPAVQPKALTPASYVPEYSETAEDKNSWTRAWLMLDISATGKVMRVKLLNKPGLDLDTTAIRESFKLKFEPARDRSKRAIPAMVLWTFEWPAYWWMLDHKKHEVARLASDIALVPCRGTQPSRAHRDCSKPDIAKAVSEAWIDTPPK